VPLRHRLLLVRQPGELRIRNDERINRLIPTFIYKKLPWRDEISRPLNKLPSPRWQSQIIPLDHAANFSGPPKLTLDPTSFLHIPNLKWNAILHRYFLLGLSNCWSSIFFISLTHLARYFSDTILNSRPSCFECVCKLNWLCSRMCL
jgi:hypothetical protein